ncbi:hypothetical protein OIHEL45_08375 [Sulfitobacter indolifex HEL-45]|uniref:Uncharacterized protein n=1 Tax=Sulfitobacter indolifex HEL-45 TaxID=391624 RepID=A0ABM9XB80_9RHOB|nr:hypothetical protein OIHEL45_08375 [Sulfitobacter indolifex HEL-45]
MRFVEDGVRLHQMIYAAVHVAA